IWGVDGQGGTLKAELDAPPVRGFVRNYFARKKFIPTERRHRFFLCHLPAGIPELSGECDAQVVDHHCAHTDAVVHRPRGQWANCPPTTPVTPETNSVRRCVGPSPKVKSYAGAASHHKKIHQGHESRRSRRSGNDRRADTAGHHPAADAERR